MYISMKTVKGILLPNLYEHIALPGSNSNPVLLSKKNGGTDPTKATHHIMAMYIKIRFFLNKTVYFSDFATRKYRLTAIIPMVLREAIPNVNTSKA